MICNTIGLTADSFESIYTTGGTEVEEVYGAIDYAQPIYAKIREMTGNTPLTFTSRMAGTLTDYRISGETIQDGTPSPDMPVEVQGVGERTENLVDFEAWLIRENVPYTKEGNSYTITGSLNKLYSNPYYFSDTDIYVSISGVMTIPTGSNIRIYIVKRDGTLSGSVALGGNSNIRQTLNVLGAGIKFDYASVGTCTIGNLMLNSGSTALPYIPYGYKLPLTVNGTEYPIYLGQVPTTRRIKKKVLDGTEAYGIYAAYDNKLTTARVFTYSAPSSTAYVNYLRNAGSVWFNEIEGFDVAGVTLSKYFWLSFDNARLGVTETDTREERTTKFKSYLAQQYANGTPVTIWYVLAEPETGIVNEPLMRIDEYADTISFAQAGVTIPTASGANVLDMTSAVKPSQMYIKGKIKPDGYGNLTDRTGVYILDKDGIQLTVHGQGTSN